MCYQAPGGLKEQAAGAAHNQTRREVLCGRGEGEGERSVKRELEQ